MPNVLPPSSILPPEVKSSASISHIEPPTRPRRSVQPAFATTPRTSKRSTRPSFPGGIGSYGGFSATGEPSPPPNNPLENSFAANRPPSSRFTFTAKPPSQATKTSSEVLAEFFAAKGKAPLTAAERREVARLIAESDAESSKSQSPDADPYNGVPSFSFLKATFPAPERDSISPSTSIPISESTASVGSNIAPRKRRPINYGGSKRSVAITKAGFTLREHQKLLEKKAKQENVAPDSSSVGDKRNVRDTEEDGGGKRRRTNDGQSAAVEEPKSGVAKLFSLSAQPNMPSPLRQMTKLNSPSPPRVSLRAQAPSPASPLSRITSEDAPTSKSSTKPASAQTPAKSKPPRKSLVSSKPVESKSEVPLFFKAPKPVETKPAPVEVKPTAVVKPAPVPVPETKSTVSKPVSEADLKASASAVPVSALPVFSFTPTAASTPKSAEARAAADLPISKLPAFTFGSLVSAPVTKTASFNWAAAGFKAPAAPSASTWTCSMCMLSNPASATEKCTVCDAKKPGASTPTPTPVAAPAPAAKTASFDWGAAGIKAPTAPTGGSWTCSTCSLSNPASATDKCTVCDAAKPGAAPATKTTSFNWGAAGIKAPSTSTGGQWTCSTCSLSNPASATEKCTVCDAKKPGAVPVTKTASFDWGAAGLKAPSLAAGWTCSTCGLSNPDSAAKCTVCDAAR
ncbi:zf-RanBP domain protein [Rhizoctonia solani AG-3 Rhs1AP]|uniref:Zf-RanBP domain protein n=2 Tax=Rhizoctonia solani AG-3 TaxID=1086053 RepID=A0A074SBA1_9AGAM|nr:zf-RanBP domain protein [Rhizoctonia solani AG-3 Rhs1AP]KEP54173.1 zf-RanBP domain protein [Rhizoctonia solani 123E]